MFAENSLSSTADPADTLRAEIAADGTLLKSNLPLNSLHEAWSNPTIRHLFLTIRPQIGSNALHSSLSGDGTEGYLPASIPFKLVNLQAHASGSCELIYERIN